MHEPKFVKHKLAVILAKACAFPSMKIILFEQRPVLLCELMFAHHYDGSRVIGWCEVARGEGIQVGSLAAFLSNT